MRGLRKLVVRRVYRSRQYILIFLIDR